MIEPYDASGFEKGDRVIVGTRDGDVDGNVVAITPRRNTLAIQADGYSDLIYRNPKHVRKANPKPAESEIGRQVRELNAATGQRLLIDESCPGCGWVERWFDGSKFGCNKCDHTGEFRDI